MALFTYPVVTTAIDTTGLATEAKQDDGITLLTSLNGKDYSTETTLAALNTKVTAVDTTGKSTEAKQDSEIVLLTSLNGKDYSTETTLAALNAKVTAADTTGKALESKQDTAITALGNLLLEATFTGRVGEVAASPTANTVLARLKEINDSLSDVSTQTTLAALLVELQAKADLIETQPVSAASLPLPSGASTSANQTTGNSSLSNIEADIGTLEDRVAGSLVPDAYDHITTTYRTTGNGIGEIDTVVYKTGGSGGSTVATLTLAYDANDKLSTVAKT